MKRELTEQVSKKYFIVECDIRGCDYTVRDKNLPKCCICGKQLCPKHIFYFYDEPSGDYPSHTACEEHKDLVQDAYDTRNDLLNDIPEVDALLRALARNKGIDIVE